MAETHHKEHPKYMHIFWWLLGLTIVEVAVAIPEYATLLKGILLIGLACGKAILVANYFMHLKFERKTLALIVITPFLICVFLVFMLMPDLTAEKRLENLAPQSGAATKVINTSH